jgi:hypothetical protein
MVFKHEKKTIKTSVQVSRLEEVSSPHVLDMADAGWMPAQPSLGIQAGKFAKMDYCLLNKSINFERSRSQGSKSVFLFKYERRTESIRKTMRNNQEKPPGAVTSLRSWFAAHQPRRPSHRTPLGAPISTVVKF